MIADLGSYGRHQRPKTTLSVQDSRSWSFAGRGNVWNVAINAAESVNPSVRIVVVDSRHVILWGSCCMSATKAESSEDRPTRRTVLLGVGGLGAAAVVTTLAACGSGGSNPTSARAADTASGAGATLAASTPSPASTAPTTSTAPAASTAPTAGSSAQGLAKSADIPVGGGKIFADREVVVTQPTKGVFKAFTAICTHLGCTVGTISGGLITCPCHGSQYSIVDGSVKRGPAPAALGAKSVTVTNGEVSVA